MPNEPREATDLNEPKERADVNKNKLNRDKCKIIHFLKIKCKRTRGWEIEIKSGFGKKKKKTQEFEVTIAFVQSTGPQTSLKIHES